MSRIDFNLTRRCGMVVMLFAAVASPAQAVVNIQPDVVAPVHVADEISTFQTWGGPDEMFHMEGMKVTATFSSGATEEATWSGAGVADPGGRAQGASGWVVENLTVPPLHSCCHEWQVTYPGGPEGTLTGLEFDGLALFFDQGVIQGNTVFDRFIPEFTPDTSNGVEFHTDGLENFDIDATYREPVALTGMPPQNDIWRYLQLDFKNRKESKWLQQFEPNAGENVPSNVDWRRILIDPLTLDRAVADDFESNGQPITSIRWWGSYFNSDDQPKQGERDPVYQPPAEDAFLISFFAAPVGAGVPGQLLGSYVAPVESVLINPENEDGWDEHPVWRYEVALEDTILDHTEFPELARPDAFHEVQGTQYWISIAAADGLEVDPESGEITPNDDPQRTADFWGWHTSPDVFNADPQQSQVTMPTEDVWRYPQWGPVPLEHPDPESSFDMAFELFFTADGPGGLDGTNSLTFFQDTDTTVVPEPASAISLLMAASLLACRRTFGFSARRRR